MSSATSNTDPEHSRQADTGTIVDLAYGFLWSRCLAEIADLKVADALGETAETPAELAHKVGANADALGRVMRLLATKGVFEDLDGRFRHTALSRLLRADHPQSIRGFVRMVIPSWTFLGSFNHTMRTGRPAVEALESGGFWEFVAKNPTAAQIFDEGMASKAHDDVASILRAYDFSTFGSIADIGGGRGHLLKAILDVAPKAKGILFDLPHVIDGAQAFASGRLTLKGGDFFKDSLPVCDAYLLMQVIHDWDDDDSVKVLSAVRKVATAMSKLLVIEMLLPETPQPHPALLLDTMMMAYAAGRERKRSRYEALLKAAGFRVERVIPTESAISILESVPA
jgi:O-methyltransferase domain